MPLPSAPTTERRFPPRHPHRRLEAGEASTPLHVEAWGRLSYGEALDRQLALWERRVRGDGEDVIAIVEHPSVITLGRNAPLDDVLVDRDALERDGIALVRSDRGGRATYHGPGQAVIYPIVSLQARGLGVKQWVAMLEDALLETLRRFSVQGRTIEGKPGVWVGDDKIASLGLRVARGVSYHGVSINVEARATQGFGLIITCGTAGQRVTSLADHFELHTSRAGRDEQVTVEEAAAAFAQTLIQRLQAHERP